MCSELCSHIDRDIMVMEREGDGLVVWTSLVRAATHVRTERMRKEEFNRQGKDEKSQGENRRVRWQEVLNHDCSAAQHHDDHDRHHFML